MENVLQKNKPTRPGAKKHQIASAYSHLGPRGQSRSVLYLVIRLEIN